MTTDPRALADAMDPRLRKPDHGSNTNAIDTSWYGVQGCDLIAASDYIRTRATPPADWQRAAVAVEKFVADLVKPWVAFYGHNEEIAALIAEHAPAGFVLTADERVKLMNARKYFSRVDPVGGFSEGEKYALSLLAIIDRALKTPALGFADGIEAAAKCADDFDNDYNRRSHATFAADMRELAAEIRALKPAESNAQRTHLLALIAECKKPPFRGEGLYLETLLAVERYLKGGV